MNLNLDDAMAAGPAWSFDVTADGVVYPTRPPTADQRAAFGAAATLSDAQTADLLGSLFAGDRPDVAAWSPGRLQSFASAYADYAARHAAERQRACTAFARAAVAAQFDPPAGQVQ